MIVIVIITIWDYWPGIPYLGPRLFGAPKTTIEVNYPCSSREKISEKTLNDRHLRTALIVPIFLRHRLDKHPLSEKYFPCPQFGRKGGEGDVGGPMGARPDTIDQCWVT
jgi:hypothetical protein